MQRTSVGHPPTEETALEVAKYPEKHVNTSMGTRSMSENFSNPPQSDVERYKGLPFMSTAATGSLTTTSPGTATPDNSAIFHWQFPHKWPPFPAVAQEELLQFAGAHFTHFNQASVNCSHYRPPDGAANPESLFMSTTNYRDLDPMARFTEFPELQPFSVVDNEPRSHL